LRSRTIASSTFWKYTMHLPGHLFPNSRTWLRQQSTSRIQVWQQAPVPRSFESGNMPKLLRMRDGLGLMDQLRAKRLKDELWISYLAYFTSTECEGIIRIWNPKAKSIHRVAFHCLPPLHDRDLRAPAPPGIELHESDFESDWNSDDKDDSDAAPSVPPPPQNL